MVEQHLGNRCYGLVPSLFWFNASDIFLQAVWSAGVILSAVLFLGLIKRFCLVFLYILYLSLFYAGQVFMSFQWDIFLLEVGFLAIFLGKSKWIVYLFRWLLFRLMLLSGAVKLLSGDVAWRNFTALTYHYETQPLPTWISWYMHQLPVGFQKFSLGTMFFIELVVPFLIFFPRRIRFFSAIMLSGLQVLIFLTGNYNFFNLLTMSLCLLLLDDQAVSRFIPRFVKKKPIKICFERQTRNLRKGIVLIISIVILSVSTYQLMGVFFKFNSKSLDKAFKWIDPFQIVNTYGLFAVMTKSRPEIVVEGSIDNKTWLEYEFKYKPGDLQQRPMFVEPHQPRLDWQMWFAALGNYRANLWFVNFAVRLLENSPSVLKLLKNNPFKEKPPKYIRAIVYDYHFTAIQAPDVASGESIFAVLAPLRWDRGDPQDRPLTDFEARKASGAWWKREYRGIYLPAISLRDE